MISLVLLPILCLIYLQEKGVFREYRLLRVFRITKEFYEPSKSDAVIYMRPPEKQDLEIWLNGNEEQARANLETAQLFLRRLVSERDTLKGIHFKFSDGAKYWMFVRALHICKIEKAQHFVTLENNVRAYYEEPEPNSSETLKPILFCKVILENAQLEQSERQNTLATLHEFWPLALIFSALIAFSLVRSRFDNFSKVVKSTL